MHCDHLASHNRSGFTLIELTIVLVIIGLIAGGVLFGRDLITSASIRAQISQLESYETAYHTFKSKYGCLPGDCSNAEELGLTDEGSDGNGNGDGVIGFVPVDFSFFALGIEEYETLNFWEHLSKARLIPEALQNGKNVAVEAGGTVPRTRLNPNATIQPENFALLTVQGGQLFPFVNPANSWVIKGTASYEGIMMDGRSIAGTSPQESYAIDSKTDDGLPFSGKTQVANLIECVYEYTCRRAGGNQLRIFRSKPTVSEWGEEYACVDDTTTPPSYYLSTQLNAAVKCDMVIKASF
ncbi:MAG: type II secretion system GspH family protein [Rickettsiales bacterium]|jgi:prepilin-type N-terminal cleavage/methylation domain-containing protein|nr:type II secretion system GspH family protein [Rickettsiales bacterium]